jgi:2-oxoglutarate ferredoxin oxidoreductase subunit alpha
MRIRAFPFHEDVLKFVEDHEQVFVVEQNRDAQFRSLLINELEISPAVLLPVLNFDGMPITADSIIQQIKRQLPESKPAKKKKLNVA